MATIKHDEICAECVGKDKFEQVEEVKGVIVHYTFAMKRLSGEEIELLKSLADIVDMLYKGWLESEKIKEFLGKYR